jgi:hypothetical protein
MVGDCQMRWTLSALYLLGAYVCYSFSEVACLCRMNLLCFVVMVIRISVLVRVRCGSRAEVGRSRVESGAQYGEVGRRRANVIPSLFCMAQEPV